MQNGIPVGLRSSPSFGLSRSGQLTAIIQSLFWDGSQGWWYDDDDLTTLFQDSAGTTPVTAVEQFVGLQLDKSKGLVLGPELVTNGNFSAGTTGWATWNANAQMSVANGQMTITQPVGGNQVGVGNSVAYTTVVGRTYQVSLDVISYVGSQPPQLRIGDYNGAVNTTSMLLATGTGRRTAIFTANTTATFVNVATDSSAGNTVTFDNISVRELPGNHRYQTTSGSRPVWSKRVNLLTKTEQFDDAVWTKGNVTVTPNVTQDPNGTTTADVVDEGTTTNFHNITGALFSAGTYTVSVFAKNISAQYVILTLTRSAGEYCSVIYDTVGGTVANSGVGGIGFSVSSTSIVSVGNSWYRCVMTCVIPNSANFNIGLANSAAIGSFGLSSYTGTSRQLAIWGADARPANQATGLLPLYQRVNTSSDYDTNGFPGYLKADGIDDFLQTNSINFTATDKITLCAGVRKLSDAATGLLTELGTDSATFNGSFSIFAPSMTGANSYRFISRGTTTVTVGTGVFAAAPITNVVTGVGEISTDTCILRVNGAEVATNTADQGTGNYGNYVTYFFRRSGATSPFTGYEYGNIAVGKLLTADQLTALETYMNGLTKAY